MRVDLHNHTSRCNHCDGTTREFVIEAINQKIDVYGFADHNPMDFDTKYRMTLQECKSYEDEIIALKNEYKNDIEILLGYEVDFLDGYIPQSILDAKVDYLIGSVHFINKWGFDNPEFIGEYSKKDINIVWQDYFDLLIQMANFGRFNIVGHLDLIKVFRFYPDKIDINSLAYKALQAIKKANMAIEINSAGLRKDVKEQYPSTQILQLAYDMDIPITFGSDAHTISQIGFGYDTVLGLAKQIGYKKAVFFRQKEMIFCDLD